MRDNLSFVTSPITLDQLHILDALERHGSVSKAAQSLHRAHSALLYSIAHLERGLGQGLLDRSGYRLQLSPFGKQILAKAREILALEEELRALAAAQKSGWEAELKIVYDGLLDPRPILSAAMAVRKKSPTTVVSLYSEFLGGVEKAFEDLGAGAMLSILPTALQNGNARKLAPLRSHLVAHRDHPLAQAKRKSSALQRYPFLVVRGSDARLSMSTSTLTGLPTFHVADFVTKKMALMQRYGFGWMPEYLIEKELRSRTLRSIRWEKDSLHSFTPIFCTRSLAGQCKAAVYFEKHYLAASERFDN